MVKNTKRHVGLSSDKREMETGWLSGLMADVASNNM